MKNTYNPPFFLVNGHFETIYPALVRKVENPPIFQREIIDTPDGDFLELDWVKNDSKRLVILQHGLEGSSNRPYMLGMAKVFFKAGYDICAWNFRGCGSIMNRKAIFYHSGATYDLDLVVSKGLSFYQDITLIGFSLGGNLTLKYMGESERDPRVKRVIAISTPLDLGSCAEKLNTRACRLYEKRFLKKLLTKVIAKNKAMPEQIDLSNLHKVKSLRDFDEYFTAPIHGFEGADDYYTQNSSRFFLDGIKRPTLIINAENDPLLSSLSLDQSLTSNNSNIEFVLSKRGGHVGFSDFPTKNGYWSEKMAIDFAQRTQSVL